jgi:hypothetical protein
LEIKSEVPPVWIQINLIMVIQFQKSKKWMSGFRLEKISNLRFVIVEYKSVFKNCKLKEDEFKR